MTQLEKMTQSAAASNEAMRAAFGSWGQELSPVCIADPEVAQRRDRLAQMRKEGMTLPQIAKALGVTLSTAKSDSAKMARV